MFKADKFFFEIHCWVVHVAEDWTEQDAENALDALESEILTAVTGSGANGGAWTSLQHDGRSNATLEIVSGVTWLHEVVPVMTMVTRGTTRRSVREALAGLLTATVTSAQRVLAYQPAYFGTVTQAREVESPVVYVAAAGAERAV